MLMNFTNMKIRFPHFLSLFGGITLAFAINVSAEEIQPAAEITKEIISDTIEAPVLDSGKKEISDSSAMHSAVQADSSVNVKTDSAGIVKADSFSPAKTAIEEKIPVEENVISLKGDGVTTDYRSPRKAMFMSLIVPGWGQYYGRSKIKSAAFIVLEAACFGLRYYFIQQGDNKETEFRQYCDAHYSNTKYNDWRNWVEANTDSNTVGLGILRDNYLMHDTVYNQSSVVKDQQYYELVFKYPQFVHGWDDAEPTIEQMEAGTVPDTINGRPTTLISGNRFLIVIGSDTTVGFSRHQLDAADITAESNRLYKAADNVWFAILTNHICSAIDAAITARSYNRSLLGQERTLLDRIHLESMLAHGGSFRFAPGAVLKINF
jgi:hypothetical protein